MRDPEGSGYLELGGTVGELPADAVDIGFGKARSRVPFPPYPVALPVAISAKHVVPVVGVRAGLKVARVDAWRIVARMPQDGTLVQRPNVYLVRHPMRTLMLPAEPVQDAVPTVVLGALPDPTPVWAGFVDEFHEELD